MSEPDGLVFRSSTEFAESSIILPVSEVWYLDEGSNENPLGKSRS
jgi:hypothetical protein